MENGHYDNHTYVLFIYIV